MCLCVCVSAETTTTPLTRTQPNCVGWRIATLILGMVTTCIAQGVERNKNEEETKEEEESKKGEGNSKDAVLVYILGGAGSHLTECSWPLGERPSISIDWADWSPPFTAALKRSVPYTLTHIARTLIHTRARTHCRYRCIYIIHITCNVYDRYFCQYIYMYIILCILEYSLHG